MILNMKKQKAISILKNQINKINEPSQANSHWITETRTYLKHFFGEDSEQQKKLHYVSFEEYPLSNSKEEVITEMQNFLNSCIDTINNVGLYKSPKNNILYHLPNWLIGLIFTMTTGLTILVSTYLSSNNNLRIELENEKLKDSISLIRKTIPEPKHKDSVY